MKLISKLSLAGCLLLGGAFSASADQLLAFPGAEGFGRYATGGRGGEIYHVTNLDDSGTGSLRDAVSKSGRIVVFDVSGIIRLKSGLVFSGNSTILGQTAPGEGIQVYGDRVSFSGASNLIVRHMRFRMGVDGTSGKDAAGIANGHTMIFDHLSVLWGQDECFSINPDGKGTEPHSITIQNSIIGQGLQPHSCGGLMQTNGGVTLYRNLYIENKTRNPKVKGIMQFVNNVSYNWGSAAAYNMSGDSEGTSWAEITDNFWVRGPWNSAARPLTGGNERQHYYGAGNYYDSNIDGNRDDAPFSEDVYTNSGGNRASTLAEVSAGMGAQTTGPEKSYPEIAGRMTAPEALTWVIENAGASLPVRDEVDLYLIDELSSFGTLGSTNGISTEKTLPHKGTGTLYGGFKPKDTDGDGIPDEWETANGLNPNDASDAAKIASNGYANIENYVFTLDGPYPYIKNPTNVKADKIEKTAITLTWDDNSDNETGFVIEYSSDNNTFSKVGEVGANVNTYTVSGLAENKTCYFRVYAVGENGLVSTPSAVLKTLTIDQPFKPNACKLVAPANGNAMKALDAELAWSNDTKDYFGDITYTLYIGKDQSNLELVTSDYTKTTFVPANLEASNTYYWRVDATNEIGTTEGPVWSFRLVDGGVLFQTDFKNTPQEFYDSEFGNQIAGAQADILSGTKEYEFGNLVIGSTGGRIVSFQNLSPSTDSSKDYGPYTADDAGASNGAVGFIGKNGNVDKSYIKVKDIQGPWSITIYAGNADAAALSYDLSVATDTDGDGTPDKTELLTTFTFAGSKKRVFKHTYTCTKNVDGTVIIGNVRGTDKKGVNFFDVIIEKYIPGEVEPLNITSGTLNNDITYSDGSIALGFNQDIVYKGNAEISGIHQFEDIKVAASGKTLTVTYTGLDINSDYTLHIPAGTLTNADGTSSFTGDINFSTGDFPRAKIEGDNHFGKATSLPLDFTPFDNYAVLPTANGTPQSKAADYPHWITASGTVSSASAELTKTSDKVMTYFDSQAKQAYLELSAGSGTTCSVKIQETRNADIAPNWRTIRVLTEKDMPFTGTFDLNPETRMIKIVPTALSGSVNVNAFKVSDANGNFEGGTTGIEGNIASDAPVEYFNLQGIRVENPAPGLYIRRQGGETTKVMIK